MKIRIVSYFELPEWDFEDFVKNMLGHAPGDKIAEFKEKGKTEYGMEFQSGHCQKTQVMIMEEEKDDGKVTSIKKKSRGKADGNP